jgi:hypothetical protein
LAKASDKAEAHALEFGASFAALEHPHHFGFKLIGGSATRGELFAFFRRLGMGFVP